MSGKRTKRPAGRLVNVVEVEQRNVLTAATLMRRMLLTARGYRWYLVPRKKRP